jgi:hypothetical protein
MVLRFSSPGNGSPVAPEPVWAAKRAKELIASLGAGAEDLDSVTSSGKSLLDKIWACMEVAPVSVLNGIIEKDV